MGLEDEFGLFKRTNGNGRLFKRSSGMGIISGKPKRKFRRLFTRPAGFLIKRVAKGLKKGKRFKMLSVKEALIADRKEILKGKTGKERKTILEDLMGG